VKRLRAVLWALILAVAAPAAAQAPPEGLAPGDESAVVQELEVVGRLPGPAMWRVGRDGAEIAILGAVSPIPHSLVWDQTRFQRWLDGSRAVLLQAPFRPNAIETVGLLLKAPKLRTSRMEERLPPELKVRFVAARTAAGKNAGRYAHWKPQVAGFLVLSDVRRARNLSEAKPGSTVRRMAQAAKVPIRNVGDYRFGGIVGAFAGLSPEASQQCLSDALAQIDAEAEHAELAARAWASGDLKGVRAEYKAAAIDRCLLQLRNYNQVLETATADWAKAIETALAKPGRYVAVIDLRLLLRANGVLDRLKAAGAQVSLPTE
jgi:uncharacterized protein YbaP (TraB family)